MLTLPNGCYCSKPSVHPKNWRTISATIKKDWYIQYRFYDPSIPGSDSRGKSKHVFIKGMNLFKTQKERYDATRTILDNELYMLQYEGYNPITGLMRPVETIDGEISEHTPFIKALTEADKKLEVSGPTHEVIKSILTWVKKAAINLGMIALPISQVKRKDMRRMLDTCGRLKGDKWTANNYNAYRAHLMMLFKVVVSYDAIDQNPMLEIPKKKTVRKMRTTLAYEQRIIIRDHLIKVHPSLWRFVQIFFHSGGREAELLRLQGKDVDIARQLYKSIIFKRKASTEVNKTIKDIAMPFWIDIMSNCSPDDYVFSRGLNPGKKPMKRDRVTKLWNKFVKKPLGIEADLYSLKHLNTTETVDLLDEKAAAEQNSHTSTAMVIKIYDTGSARRTHEKLKKVNNTFI